MTNNPNELTIENSVLMLIDHQPWVAFAVHSIDPGLMINNVAGLAQAARDLGVPVVLTTVGARGSILVDPLVKEISDLFPGVTPIDRTSTHAWSHPEVRAAVDALLETLEELRPHPTAAPTWEPNPNIGGYASYRCLCA
jgi:nicotinamidase-related amidase